MTHDWYSEYDSLIKRVCPDYELGLDAVVRGIRESPESILELGAGTGNLTARIAEMFLQSEIIGVDNDQNMLDVAVTKLQTYQNVRLVNSDVAVFDLNEFDVIVSSLLFHMLSDSKRREILDRMYGAGVREIVIFDRMKWETPEQEESFLQYFAKQLNGKGLPDEIISQLIKESRKNNPMKLSEHRKICERSGFKFEILHQNPNHGFITYRSINHS